MSQASHHKKGKLAATLRGHKLGATVPAMHSEVGVEGMIQRPAGCTIPPETERAKSRRRGCEAPARWSGLAWWWNREEWWLWWSGAGLEGKGYCFRVDRTRHPRNAPPHAPDVARPLRCMGAGNVPNVRGNMAREVYHRKVGKPSPRSSTPGWHCRSRLPPTIPMCIPPCNRARTPKGSTGHGAPGAGACPRLQQTRPADPLSA